ncbi:MAG: hypothetical protein H6736_16605 [Alphaproteobacteria bacterium]|nr:hypothetical protein [Alphaproteobacteria bacterium]MCB9693436.1 hypothetical protein [Alphaproteobacteria bacterium]
MVFILLVACRTPDVPTETPPTPVPEPDPWAATIVQPEAVGPVVERFAMDAASAAAEGDAGAFLDAGGDTIFVDPWGRSTPLQATLGGLRASAPWADGTLIATDSGYSLWDGALQAFDLATTAGIADVLVPTGDGLWIESAEGVFLHRGTTTLEVTADGEPTHGLALGRLGSTRVIWTASGVHAVAVTVAGDGLAIATSHAMFDTVDAIAADDAGAAFALVRGWLVERDEDGTWTRIDPGEPVRELYGDGLSPAVWARTDTGWLVHEAGVWRSLVIDAVPTGSVDGAGRMLFLEEGEAIRVGTGRPVVLVDPPDGPVVLPVTVGIAPTRTDDLGALTARLVGAGSPLPLAVDTVDGVSTVELDPADHPAGLYDLEVEVAYGASSSVATTPVILGAFAPRWDTFVRPLYEDRCFACHGADIQPFLGTRDAWMANFTAVLANVAADPPVMPPDAGDALTPLEVDLLEAWAADGFPQ